MILDTKDRYNVMNLGTCMVSKAHDLAFLLRKDRYGKLAHLHPILLLLLVDALYAVHLVGQN